MDMAVAILSGQHSESSMLWTRTEVRSATRIETVETAAL